MSLNLKGKNITVVGLGVTGEAVAAFLMKQGANVFISENRSTAELAEVIERLHKKGNFAIETGGHTQNVWLDKDLIVVSPGVPLNIPVLQEARKHTVDIIGEIELASYFIPKSKLIGVTGTNGKTTVVNMIYRFLRAAGRRVALAGNVGKPLIDFALNHKNFEYIVVELSSFQLMTIRNFAVHIGCLLNLAADHFDYHTDFDEYKNAKFRLFERMEKSDRAVLNYDSAMIRETPIKTQAQQVWYSTECSNAKTYCLKNGSVWDKQNGAEIIQLDELQFIGKHNYSNLICALEVCGLCGIAGAELKDAIMHFAPPEHRLELVAKYRGVSIINDSKSTNPHSLKAAIESFDEPIILICGGKDKGLNFSHLRDFVREKVKYVVFIGELKKRLRAELDPPACAEARDLDEAVAKAFSQAAAGDVILFSPGSSSYDMFDNYKQRGALFKKSVVEFIKKHQQKEDIK